MYINVNSNHPSYIKRQIPTMIEDRLNELSSNEEVFNIAKKDYEEALMQSGYTKKLHFKQKEDEENRNELQRTREKKKRKRKVIWYNPPYDMAVKTCVAQTFLNLVKKHFPIGTELNRIFNKNTIKVSYSCMPNLGRKIKSSNDKKLQGIQNLDVEAFGCNCDRIPCPLNGHCEIDSVIYKADVEALNHPNKHYYGLTGGKFRLRYNAHHSSFHNNEYRNRTELSKYIWYLTDNGIVPTIKWSIVKRTHTYQPGQKSCNLCICEKYYILSANKDSCINDRNELVSKCRHRARWKLISAK